MHMPGYSTIHKNLVIRISFLIPPCLIPGWSGRKIVLVGDSAGGNLIISLTLRLIELNIARLPDGIIPIYTPFLFQVSNQPSTQLHICLSIFLLHRGF